MSLTLILGTIDASLLSRSSEGFAFSLRTVWSSPEAPPQPAGIKRSNINGNIARSTFRATNDLCACLIRDPLDRFLFEERSLRWIPACAGMTGEELGIVN